MRPLQFALLLVLACASASPQPDQQILRTSICELSRSGEHLNGRSIRLTAVYVTDLREHSALKDPRCPDQYLEPDWSARGGSQDHSIDEFDRALYSHPESTKLTQFVVDASGVYIWSTGDNAHGKLIFARIWSFKPLHGDWKNARLGEHK
jgi:hypothetical protein